MDLQLKGKAAVITGATRGIGRAIAELFADEGADVAICARKADQVTETVAALTARGGKAFGQAVDIADSDALSAFVADAGAALGGIDILVASASALARGGADEDWRAMFEVDMMGAVRAFAAARPFLERAAEARGDAAFVMISSVSAAESSTSSAYGPIKAAMIHYAKGLAREIAASKIRVNVVSPGTVFFEGGVWGEMQTQAPEIFRRALERNPSGRMGTPGEIAAAAVFLASPRSSFTTGINMLVDGSITARVNF